MSAARLVAVLSLLLALLACLASAAGAQTIDITPRPLVAQVRGGGSVTFGAGDPVVAPAGDAAARQIARNFSELVFKSRRLRLASAAHPTRRSPVSIILARGGDGGAEGYSLDIDAHGARITAASDAGLYYGAVSLWQLMTADAGTGAVTLRPMHIVDAPRFAYRGLLLDSARHFQSPAFVERMIDWMSLHKLNVLQWHLTDDQGWRIQIRRYPRLTSVGAWRPGIDRATGRPIRYGGFYTQADIRRIVAYARRRSVMIVPEIEMPGHSLSAILAYPELGVAPADPKTQGDWGIFPDILDPNERTYAFMTGVLTEVMDLFPGAWINIGGDEAVKDQWKASPQVQAQIKQLGLANEDALQGWFTARIGAFLAAHHRRMIGWDDILVGGAGLPADAATVSWHADGAIKATSAGHDTVIATDPLLYFDHRQADIVGEPPGRGTVVSLTDVYLIDPRESGSGGALLAPASAPPLTPDQAAHIIGVQANLWTEHMPTEADVAKMAFPRAAALAEVAWSDPTRKDSRSFAARLPAELARYRPLGLEPDTSERAPRPTPSAERRVSQELEQCTNKVVLNLAGVDDRQPDQPYLVDAMNPCWLWRGADLGHSRHIRLLATRLPFNFQLGADLAHVTQRPATTPAGEFEVRIGGCDVAPALRLPLTAPAALDGAVSVTGDLPAAPGKLQDLCLTFTQPGLDPMWVIAAVELRP